MHFCSYLCTRWSKFHKWGTVGIPGCRRGQGIRWRHSRHLGLPAILNYIKNLQKALQVTQIVWFPRDLTHRIFRPSLTKAIMCNILICFHLPVAANQTWHQHAKQDMWPYLCNGLTCWKKTWQYASTPRPKWTRWIWCHLGTRGRCI